MLIYKNINGEQEAVSKKMVVRFSRREDMATNCTKLITFIHLANSEKLKSLDEIETLLKQMNKEKNIKRERKSDGSKEKQTGKRSKNGTARIT